MLSGRYSTFSANWICELLGNFLFNFLKHFQTILDKINGTSGNSSSPPLPHNNVEKHSHDICLTSVPRKYTF